MEESRQEGDKSRYNQPIFTRGEGKVTQAPKGGQIKHKVILEYSSNEVSESQLDQISPEYPMTVYVAKIKKTKKSVKLTIPRHPTVEGLTESFITWYKDHGITTSLRKALEANGWTEQMIHEFKWVYIRKYKISQDYVMRYPDKKLTRTSWKKVAWPTWWVLGESSTQKTLKRELMGPHQRGQPRRRRLRRPAHRTLQGKEKRKQSNVRGARAMNLGP